ncbi:11431_t:CDS:2 [Paraglomus brasilianum]|uniref:11431_t:CDS:1 n=1 Tax=Paraglomus brasilianum TaxID=144538 RepID=A0A9N9CY67_9GLOM|nr:11431_t:CDS:2 [Paraglomus brasilianum]
MSAANLIISPQDSNTEIEHYNDKKPLSPSPPKQLPNNTIPSRAKKLVDKFTTFSTRSKGSDRQLTVETTICNAGRKEYQPEVRSTKSTDTSKVKKKKRPPINITEGMSRADIFAAKVSSAVDASEDTDDEDFIYRDRGHSRTSSAASLNGPNPHSPFTSPHMPQGYNNYSVSSHNSFGYSRYGSLNRPQDYGYFQGNAPDTDDYIPRNCKNFGLHKPGTIRPALPDMWVRVKGEYPNYGATEYFYPDSVETPYYGHDSRRLPLFIKRRPPYKDQRRIIDITNVLAADKELMFDMDVQARNFDLWDIEIVDADLDIFAIPTNPADLERTKNSTELSPSSIIPNEYLGRVLYLDEKLVFTGGTHRKGIVSTASSQVRLKNPGGRSDKDAQNRWSQMFRHDFVLIVRGFLKYSLPFAEDNSVRVCYFREVDGTAAPSDNSTTKQPLALDVMTVCNEEWN